MRIRHGNRKERTIKGYKTYVFKAMQNIIHKNIQNYFNLLNGSPCRDIPEYNEILSECYIIFDKCIEKYKITKYNNFYFYFNKALSRNFYRCYQKEINFPAIELTKEIAAVHPRLASHRSVDTPELLLHNLKLTELEEAICRSRLNGEKGTEFLRRNEHVTQKQYNDAIKRIKATLIDMCEKEDIKLWK
jgi:hypothetical protein